MPSSSWVERNFTEPKTDRRLVIKIDQPIKERIDSDWSCRVIIELDGLVEKEHNVLGIDGIQCLQNAFRLLRNALKDRYVDFLWLSEDPAFLSFPATVPTFLGLEFYEHCCGILEIETARTAKQ